ncbi:MAG: c-type cytochrome [Phototrophicaceae bacterium]
MKHVRHNHIVQLCLAVVMGMLVGCSSMVTPPITYADLPEMGDPVRGEAIYLSGASGTVTPCNGCHVENSAGAPALIGVNYAEVAQSRVPEQSARQYTFQAIVAPASYVVAGYGNAMPEYYGIRLSAQDLADVIAYLLSSP